MLDIKSFLREMLTDAAQSVVSHDELEAFLMPWISARINPATADFKQLRKHLQAQFDDGDLMDLAAAEMTAVWMTELPQPRGRIEGMALLEWLSDRGIMSARYNLAVKMLDMKSKPAVCAKAFRHLQSVVQAPDIDDRLRGMAHYSIGGCYMESRGVSWNAMKAINHLRKAADLGHADAAFLMGLAHDEKLSQTGPRLAKADPERAAHYYEMACNAGSLKGKTNLGILHICLKFPGADQDRGRQLLRESFSAGDSVAGEVLRRFDSLTESEKRGEASPPPDDPKKRADADLERILHHCYLNGRPSDADFLAMSPEEVNEQVVDHAVVTGLLNLIIRVRSAGYLKNENDFMQVLRRLETPRDRRALAEDRAFWRRCGLPI